MTGATLGGILVQVAVLHNCHIFKLLLDF